MFAPDERDASARFTLPGWLTGYGPWPGIVVMLVAAFAIAVTTENQSFDRSRLADHGITVHARIDDAYVDPDPEGHARSSISFETQDGTTIHERMTVPRGLGVRARDEKAFVTLKVVYLPEAPGVVRPAGERDPAKWRYLAAIALAGSAIIAAFRRLRRLFG